MSIFFLLKILVISEKKSVLTNSRLILELYKFTFRRLCSKSFLKSWIHTISELEGKLKPHSLVFPLSAEMSHLYPY